jgi:hypothetical protein
LEGKAIVFENSNSLTEKTILGIKLKTVFKELLAVGLCFLSFKMVVGFISQIQTVCHNSFWYSDFQLALGAFFLAVELALGWQLDERSK